MANTSQARGFECKGVPLRENSYVSGAACYPGDLVGLDNTGRVVPVAAGGEILGVCLSYASAAAANVNVADHPDQLIIGQCTAAGIDAQTNIGNMYDITATAGNSTYKTSRQVIDGASVGTGTAQLEVLSIEVRPNNDFGALVKAVCRINEHQFGDSNAGI